MILLIILFLLVSENMGGAGASGMSSSILALASFLITDPSEPFLATSEPFLSTSDPFLATSEPFFDVFEWNAYETISMSGAGFGGFGGCLEKMVIFPILR